MVRTKMIVVALAVGLLIAGVLYSQRATGIEGKECTLFIGIGKLSPLTGRILLVLPNSLMSLECWADYARPEWIDIDFVLLSGTEDGGTGGEMTQLTKERRMRARYLPANNVYATEKLPPIEELKQSFEKGFENKYILLKGVGLTSYGGMEPKLFQCGVAGCLVNLDRDKKYSHVYTPQKKKKRGGGFRIISNRGEGSAVRSHVTPLKEPVLGIVGGVAPMW